jgi:hypothetical protein
MGSEIEELKQLVGQLQKEVSLVKGRSICLVIHGQG